MLKRVVVSCLLLISPALPLSAQSLESVEKAFEAAFSAVPVYFEYHEKSGALMLNQYKDYRYEIIPGSGEKLKRCVYSSTQNEKSRPEDPRPPVKEGQISSFSMHEILNQLDLCSGSSPGIVYRAARMFKGVRCSVFDISYSYPDENGDLWPMKGELLLEYSTKTPVLLRAEQLELPDDLYSLSVEADFKGTEPSDCRVTEFRLHFTGQYGIFRYHCDMERTFSYR